MDEELIYIWMVDGCGWFYMWMVGWMDEMGECQLVILWVTAKVTRRGGWINSDLDGGMNAFSESLQKATIWKVGWFSLWSREGRKT